VASRFSNLQRWISRLGRHVRSHTLDRRTVQQILEDLQKALEELQVIEEELRLQNDELIIARRSTEQQRRRYEELFGFIGEGQLVTDMEGNIREANTAAAALLGIPLAALWGRSLLEMVADPDKTALSEQVSHVRRTGKTVCREVAFDLERRAAAPTAVAMGPSRDLDGKMIGLRWAVREAGVARCSAGCPYGYSKLVHTVVFAAEVFLADRPWRESITKVLERIRVAAEVDCVRFFGRGCSSGCGRRGRGGEWFTMDVPTGEGRGVSPAELQSEPAFSEWWQRLCGGRVVVGSAYRSAPAIRRLFQEARIQSILLVPIGRRQELAGVLILEDRRKRREWSWVEIDSLLAVAKVVAAAM